MSPGRLYRAEQQEYWQPGKFSCNVQIRVVTDNRTYGHNIVNDLLIHFTSKTFFWDRCWVQALLPTLRKPHTSTVSQVPPLQQIFLNSIAAAVPSGVLLGFLRGGMQGRKEFLQKKRWLCAASDFRDSRDKVRRRLQKGKTWKNGSSRFSSFKGYRKKLTESKQ